MRFGMVVFSASVTEKMGESVNRDEANYVGPLNREKNRNSGMSTTWDRLTGNREPVPRLTRKRILTCFPSPPLYPLHSEFTSSERRNEPHPRILFLPVRWIHEEVACIYIYTVAQRSAGQIAFGTEHWPGQREALRENDSRCRSPVNQPFPPPFPFFHFLFFSPLCPFYVP